MWVEVPDGAKTTIVWGIKIDGGVVEYTNASTCRRSYEALLKKRQDIQVVFRMEVRSPWEEVPGADFTGATPA